MKRPPIMKIEEISIEIFGIEREMRSSAMIVNTGIIYMKLLTSFSSYSFNALFHNIYESEEHIMARYSIEIQVKCEKRNIQSPLFISNSINGKNPIAP